MKKTIPLVACLGLALMTPVLLGAAKFYKWTDAKGVTHYSEDPPPASSKNATEVKVPTRLPSGSKPPASAGKPGATPATAATPAKKDGKSDKKEAGTAAKETETAGTGRYAEQCKQLRANLQTMQEHARVKMTDEKGESRVLTEEEKNAQLDDYKRQIKAFCE